MTGSKKWNSDKNQSLSSKPGGRIRFSLCFLSFWNQLSVHLFCLSRYPGIRDYMENWRRGDCGINKNTATYSKWRKFRHSFSAAPDGAPSRWLWRISVTENSSHFLGKPRWAESRAAHRCVCSKRKWTKKKKTGKKKKEEKIVIFSLSLFFALIHSFPSAPTPLLRRPELLCFACKSDGFLWERKKKKWKKN